MSEKITWSPVPSEFKGQWEQVLRDWCAPTEKFMSKTEELYDIFNELELSRAEHDDLVILRADPLSLEIESDPLRRLLLSTMVTTRLMTEYHMGEAMNLVALIERLDDLFLAFAYQVVIREDFKIDPLEFMMLFRKIDDGHISTRIARFKTDPNNAENYLIKPVAKIPTDAQVSTTQQENSNGA